MFLALLLALLLMLLALLIMLLVLLLTFLTLHYLHAAPAPHHLPSDVRSRVLTPIHPSTPPCTSLQTACHHVLCRAAIRSLQAHWVADTRSRGAMVHALPLVYLQAHGPPSCPHSL